MQPSSREFSRHVRPLIALLVSVGSACSDQGGITDPTPSPTTLATPPVEMPAVPSSTPHADAFPVTSTGTVAAGGPYNLRAGPGTNYSKLGTISSSTPIAIICTAVRTINGTTTTWNRLSTGAWFANTYVVRAADAPTPPACDSPAGPTITPGLRGNDYPYRTQSASGCPYDAWSFCKRQCTSFVTWRLRDVNGVAHFRYSYGGKSWGHAKSWASVARALGYRVDDTPKVGAVAQWTSSSSGYGHVAWVASVSSDRRYVTIEEYNYSTRYGYGKRTISASSVDNFIHLY